MDHDPEITAELLADHKRLRLCFTALGEAACDEDLIVAWEDLADRLDAHIEAEERILYPALLDAGAWSSGELQDAVRHHSRMRDAVRAADAVSVGTPAWRTAVATVRRENDLHIGEEEQVTLPYFRRYAPGMLRRQLGQAWVDFHADRSSGRSSCSVPQGDEHPTNRGDN